MGVDPGVLQIRLASGMSTNSKGIRTALRVEILLAWWFVFAVDHKHDNQERREIVRTKEESLGTEYPRAVLPKAGLRRVGTVSPSVIINQLTGHKK